MIQRGEMQVQIMEIQITTTNNNNKEYYYFMHLNDKLKKNGYLSELCKKTKT